MARPLRFAALSALTILVAALALAGCSSSNSEEKSDHSTKSTAQKAFEQAKQAEVCADVKPLHCYFHGMELEASNKPKVAMRYFDAACNNGVLDACYDLGVLYEEGEAVPKDQAKAKALYEKACQAKKSDGMACNNLAVMYQKGLGVTADQTKATELYRRSCELGSMLGCRNLARRYLEGKGVEQNPTRAAALLEKACNLGNAEACPQLTYLYANDCLKGGKCGAEVLDPDNSVAKLQKKCERDKQPQACLGHGFMLEAGYGGKKPAPAQAALQYEQACKAGVWAGCNYLANLYRKGSGVERNVGKAVGLYKKACDSGFMLSCHTLGVMNLNGRTIPPNPRRGFEYIRKACEGGRTASCTALEYQCYAGRKAACGK